MAGEDGEDEAEPVAVDAVRDPPRRLQLAGGDQRLHLDQDRARALHRRQYDRARRPGRVLDEPRRGIGDLAQPSGAHLEYPDLAGRAETVLQGPQGAVGALALSLELQHTVHQVLEHPRTGQAPLLGHVPDQDQRHPGALGDLGQGARRLPHLADRARRPAHLGAVQGLDRVDHAGRRALCLERRQHPLERGLGQRRDLKRRGTETLGPQPHLRRRFLTGDVEGLDPRGGEVGERHPGQRALADPGRAAEQDERARHEAARRAPGRARPPRCAAAPLGGLDLGQGDRLRRRRRRSPPRRSRGRAGRRLPGRASTSVFHSEHPGQRPDHFSERCPHSWQV